MNEAIRVIVSGGVVQDVDNIPDGIEVHVYDYDNDGVDSRFLSNDDNGIPCVIAIYRRICKLSPDILESLQ